MFRYFGEAAYAGYNPYEEDPIEEVEEGETIEDYWDKEYHRRREEGEWCE